MITTDPFAAAIEQSKQYQADIERRLAAKEALRQQREEELRAQREELRAAAERARVEREKAATEQRLQQRRIKFGREFLADIADRVVVPMTWSESRILAAKSFSVALLRTTDQQLPDIRSDDARDILDRFERGLQLPKNFGLVPEGFFFGQRLLAQREMERAGKSAKSERIVYTAPTVEDVMSRSVSTPGSAAARVVDDRPSAITPRKRRNKQSARRAS